MSASADEPRSTCSKCGALLQRGERLANQCPSCLLDLAWEENASESKEHFDHYKVATNADGSSVELGRGAMGVTYRAFDTVLRLNVALKVIDAAVAAHPEARERFLREARAAARLRHPNVASVYYYGVRKSDDQCFYAMELVEGETLETRLRRSGPIPARLALELIAQVAKALVAAETLGLMHRDLKPANLMLVEGAELTVKVIDFGLAKAATATTNEADLTHGGFVGTPAFASPEQLAGTSLDVRSDLYSLGITLWEMLTGQTPFRGSAAEVKDQHQRAPLPIEQVKGVPQPVVALLEVLLEKDPARRLQRPTELLNALPKVTAAVKARRTITQQSLREITDQPLGAPGRAIQILKISPDIIAARGVRLILWPALMLAIVGGAILTANIFFGPRTPSSQPPGSSSPVTPVPERSIAILPFDNISPNKEDAYFADGVQDEILNNLARIAQLKVISRTTVMKYRASTERDLHQIANALGVANVLEGTVRRDGNRVRVSTELVDARNDNTIWADSYDRDLTDIFAIQSEIAQSVASKLSAKLSPEERKDIEEKPTDNLEAYDLYLQAKRLRNAVYFGPPGGEEEADLKIIGLLKEAIQKDSKFALAYCLIAYADDDLYSERLDHTPERLALGDAAVNEALRLRPDLPDAHLALAVHLYSCYRDFERARVQIAIASQTVSNNSDLLELTALIDRVQGRWGKSTETLERAITLDPRNVELVSILSESYFAQRRFQDAERTLDRAIRLEPDFVGFLLLKGWCASAEKADVKGARAACEALPSSTKDEPEVVQNRVWLALFARDFAAAEEILKRDQNKELPLCHAVVPREIDILWVEFIQGNHPGMEQFGAAREQLNGKVKGDPTNPFLLTALAWADLALGRKQEAIEEGQHVMELRPISEDAVDGPDLATWIAQVYALANEPDAAFAQLNILVKIPVLYLNYGDLKMNPSWDPLRKDPRFGKLLAQLAPRD